MNRSCRGVAVLSLLVCIAAAPSGAADEKAFAFSKVDLSLLVQTTFLDKKYENQGLVFVDERLNDYLDTIGRSVIPAGAAPENVTWRFRALRDPQPNAFAVPNGSIYVHTGLLSLLENEDQLASVLAHEVTHVLDRHTYLAFRDYRKKAAIANIAAYASSMAPGGTVWGLAVQLGGALIPVIMNASINGYSRELERAADKYSFGKLVDGGYDPEELANTFRLLERKDEVDVQKIYYNDHPKLEERITYMKELVSAKGAAPVAAEKKTERRTHFQEMTEFALREDVNLAILAQRPRTALARAKKLIDYNPGAAENQFLVGEAYRALGPWTPAPTPEELSKDGKKDLQKMQSRLTADEQESELMKRPAGQDVWKTNDASALEYYRKAIALNPKLARTYRGLGLLHERSGRNAEAIEAFSTYLKLRFDALDKAQVEARIQKLERKINMPNPPAPQ